MKFQPRNIQEVQQAERRATKWLASIIKHPSGMDVDLETRANRPFLRFVTVGIKKFPAKENWIKTAWQQFTVNKLRFRLRKRLVAGLTVPCLLNK